MAVRDSGSKGDPIAKMFSNKNEKTVSETEGAAVNPFARGGLARSPPKAARAEVGAPPNTLTGAQSGAPPEEALMSGADLTRALNRNRDGLPKMMVVVEQLDHLIEFTSGRTTISKDLKQGLLKLRKSVNLAKMEYDILAEEQSAVDARKEERSTQTDSSLFAGNATTAHESMQLAGAVGGRDNLPTARATRPEQAKTYAGKVKSAGVKKRPAEDGQKGATASTSSQASKPTAKRAKGNRGKEQPKKVNPARKAPNQPNQGEENPWITVGKKKPLRKAKAKQVRKRDKGEALVFKTEADTYAEVLRAMRGENRLSALGADVKSIRRTRAGEMIMVLKKEAGQKGPSYKVLAQEVLGDKVEVRALTAEATLQVKNLDEITDAEELAAALKQQCEIEVQSASVRLRKGPAGTQIAAVKLPVGEVNKAIGIGKIRVGWSVCPLSIYEPPEACFRCFEQGHKSWECKGPDRSKLCRKCGEEGHIAKDCKSTPKCLICKANKGHMTGGPKCPSTRGRPNNRK